MMNAITNRRLLLVVSLGLVVVIFAAYGQVINFGFVAFDDEMYITENSQVQKGISPESIIWALGIKGLVYWHPLTWFSHMLDCQLFGLNPGRHHLTGLLIHAANTLLLFLTLQSMTGALWRSAVVAGLFAIHPLNVESVAWVAERKNLLSTFFWILTMWGYACYARQPGFKKYMLVLAFFALGLMAKPMLVTLPFVLLLLDYWPLDRLRLNKFEQDYNRNIAKNIASTFKGPLIFRLILEKIPLVVLSVASIFLALSSVKHVISLKSTPMNLRMANALVSYIKYIGKMIWPQNLAFFYPYSEALPWFQIVGSGMLLVSISYLALSKMRKRPYLIVGWLWYLGTLVPVIGLLQWDLWPAMADRFTYVPLIGLFILVSWGASDIFARFRRAKALAVITTGTVLAAFLICTPFQVRHWQNSLALFTHALAVTSENSVAHYSLGVSLEKEKRLDEALFHYSRALQISPDDKTYFNMGSVLYQQGKLDEAMIYYAKALQANPNHAKAHNNMGILLARQGDANRASKHYLAAVRINPNHAGAYYNLGQISANQGKTAAAILYYRQALRVEPNMAQALYRQAWIAATHENIKFRNGIKAVELSEKLCKLTDYNEPLALDVLAAAYAEAGRYEEAVQKAEKAHKLALISGPEELIAGVKKRLQLYQAGSPYRQH